MKITIIINYKECYLKLQHNNPKIRKVSINKGNTFLAQQLQKRRQSKSKERKMEEILGSTRRKTIFNRFNIIRCLLQGKKDIMSGSPHGGIMNETELSEMTVRNFLEGFVKSGYVKKTFIEKAGVRNFSVSCPAHNEYELTEYGILFTRNELESWEKLSVHDENLYWVIKGLIKKYFLKNVLIENFIDRNISMSRIEISDFIKSAGDNGSIFLELFLHEYPIDGVIDKFGNSEYSIQLEINDMKIRKIWRYSHLRSFNHENRDIHIKIYPHEGLENEAFAAIQCIMKS